MSSSDRPHDTHQVRTAAQKAQSEQEQPSPGTTKFWQVPWYQRFMLLAIISMPFQYALTVDLGFPLKLSEVFTVASIAAFVLRVRSTHRRSGFAELTMVILTVWIVLSSIANFSPDAAGLRQAGFERGYSVDLVMYAFYGILAIALWFIVRRMDTDRITRAIVWSVWPAGIAVGMQWIASITGSTALIGALGFRTVGIDGSVGTLRSGPFLEGQPLGFFMGAALLVALYRRSSLAALVCAASILYSQSTTAYLGLGVGLLLMVLVRNIKVLIPALGVSLILSLVVLTVPDLRDILGRQLAKLGFTEFAPDYQYATTSLDLRGQKTGIAFDMANSNPIFGVGPGRFGAYFDLFVNGRSLPWVYSTSQTRPIVENAYGQLAAELGYLALVLFVLFLAALVLRSLRSSGLLLALAVFLTVGVATQSSWTFLPIWMFLGVLGSLPLAGLSLRRGESDDAAEAPAADLPSRS
jgi:hypothetical protein